MKKRIISLLTAVIVLFSAVPAFASNTYLSRFEGEYFNSLPDDSRDWFGYKLNIYNMTDTEMSFDFEYEKPGHAVMFSEEKAIFTDSYTAMAKGTTGYADQSENSFPVIYNFTFENNHILLKICNAHSGEIMYDLDFYSNAGNLLKGITVLANNREVMFEQKPIIIENRTLVPMRAIMEAFGANVDWNGETKTVIAAKDDVVVKLSIDSDTMYVNDEAVKIDVPAHIVNGSTLVPVRVISEAYNMTVDWDDNTKTISINTTDNSNNISVSYSDISKEVNQIRSFIENGLYLEAMQKCEQTKSQFSLSPDDNRLISDLYVSAKTNYQKYLEESSKITFDQAKQLILNDIGEEYRPDSRFNLISEDDDYYHIRVLWHNSVTGNNNLWGEYKVGKKSQTVEKE